MKIFTGKACLNLVHKICLTGLFIALTAILQKVAAINYLPGMPYFRISLGGPAVIIFSSIFLGPFYGALVGGLSDIIGYFMFDASSFPWMFQITLTYALLGFVSFFVFELIKKIKNTKALIILETIFLGIVVIGLLLYTTLFLNIEFIGKIILSIVIFLFYLGLLLFLFLFKREDQIYKKHNLSFSLLIIEIFVMLIFGVLMKCWAFNVFYKTAFSELFSVIFMAQSISCVFNVFFNTIVITIFLRVTKKYYIEEAN